MVSTIYIFGGLLAVLVSATLERALDMEYQPFCKFVFVLELLIVW